MSKKKQSILLNLLFYGMLLILISIILYPHTIFYYYKEPFSSLTGDMINKEIVLCKGTNKKIFINYLAQDIRYSSSDFKVAYVNGYGRVYGNKIGRAVIKVKIKKSTYRCKVYVIDINKKNITINIDETEQLAIEGKYKKVSWNSSKPSIVKVSKNGKITGIKEGKAIIYGKVKDTRVTCQVTVKK